VPLFSIDNNINNRYINLHQERRVKENRNMQYCNSENTEKIHRCVDNFLAHKLKCNLPWTKTQGRKCSTKKELDLFFSIKLDINSGEIYDEIKEFGCGMDNCVQNHWKPQTISVSEESEESLVYTFMWSNKVFCSNNYSDRKVGVYLISNFEIKFGFNLCPR
jgi:hypothetical protein